MNTVILLCAVMFAADHPAQAQAKVLYGTGPQDEQRADIELWISKAVAKTGSPLAQPHTGWITLTGEDERLYTANGFIIDGKATEKDGKYEVKIDACAGFPLDRKVTLKPGERRVINLTDNPAPNNVFIAFEAPVSGQAKKRAEAMKADAKTFRLELRYNGSRSHPAPFLFLSVPDVGGDRSSPPIRFVQVKEDEAGRIIDHLARDGFLDNAIDLRSNKPGRPAMPGYTMKVVTGNMSLHEDLGWGLPMIHRLDDLGAALPENGKKGMDFLLERLSFHRKLWEAEAIQNQKTSLKGWELYIWQEAGKAHFSLMVGTNRGKSDEEIAKSAVKGLDAIKLKLDQLKKSESVFLHGRRLSEQAPGELAKVAANYCEKIGLKAQ